MSAELEIVWKPNAGPQTRALASPAFELLFGGAAGGGKTVMLLAGALRYIHDPNFSGIFFRNSFGEIGKISEQEARPIYEPVGGVFVQKDMSWRFPAGSKIYLSYLERDKDVFKHQGAAYQYIGFDELTHFSLFQYRYLFSRARSKHGIPCEVRGSCNPEPGWVKERWGAWVDSGWSGRRAASGAIRSIVVDDDGIEHEVPHGTPDAITRTFVRSMLADNPFLAGTPYAANLKALDPVQRARLLGGDWGADYTPGLLFRRSMFRMVSQVPERAIRVRCWDLAATEEQLGGARSMSPGAVNDPDWTVGTLYGWAPNFGFFIEHIERLRGRPEQARAAVARIAAQDAQRYGRGNVVITIPQDPGQAGKSQAAAYVDMLARYMVHIVFPSGSKIVRAGPVSSTAEHAGISLLIGPWNELFLQEAEQFPKGHHDDQIDTISDGHDKIAELRGDWLARQQQADDSELPDYS